MTTIPVSVRHAGKKYDVELDLTESGLTFKSQLYSLTGVPPERQKILVKGGQLKDEQDMNELGIKTNHLFMLLGTAGDLPKAPAQKTQFIEDMTDRQIAQSGTDIPNGLENTGNTCYLNSTLQALRTVPELKDALTSYRGSVSAAQTGDSATGLTAALRDLYKSMGSTTKAFYPHMFLMLFRQIFPQFAERESHGMYKQQDAEEAWSQILTSLRQSLKTEEDASFVDNYFGGSFETKLECIEDAEHTPPRLGQENFWKLDCHISVNTNFLKDGLLDGLQETIEKHNDNLGRNAQYKLTKRVSRLPKYLTVHYMRFFWRADTRKKSKILRKVTFPFIYDATELCTDELKKKLLPAREKFREVEKEKDEMVRAAKRARFQETDGGNPEASINKSQTLTPEKEEEMKRSIAEAIDPDLAKDNSTNPIGLYELSAVITHKGATADAGHYQCFVKSKTEPDQWYKFNDDVVTIVDQDKVEMLAGGGESDAALILLYRALQL